MFPFQFQDKKYYGCLKIPNYENVITVFTYWCATEVDQDGVTGVTFRKCGFCPAHDETLTWRKDETVKVTLTYSNPALRVGLELYGVILLWIFVLGLILTIFTPILGKSCPVHSFS